MAPSPENDNAPKAPDKSDKSKGEATTLVQDSRPQELEFSGPSGPENKEASVSRLDDVELKALLDEAINYKIPKDRVGKSKLFQNLLEKAEEDDRKARATSASGSESVRYYNTTATHRTRRRREPSSISENLTHGGSLNNLAKEELYAVASHLNRPTKTVSARQRQGGSLPCNVNAGVPYDKKFFEEERRKMENKKLEYTAIDMESESLLEHDSLNQDYNEQPEIEVVQTRIPRIPMKYTSRFNLEIGGANFVGVDDSLTVSALERSDDLTDEVSYKPVETITAATHYPAAHYSLLMQRPPWPFNRKSVEDKKVDENGNALGQSSSDTKKNKKKKIQTDKNVVVLKAKDVAGHRSDIINDLDKLVEYIGGNEEQTGAKSKLNVHKTKFHKHHFGSGDEKGVNKKQRTRSKGKSEKLQKSNSMEEISISKLDDFNFSQECDGNKVPLRSTKSNTDRPRERRSWGNSESLPLHASAENLETADFRVVTKKKKSKKRRNSVSGRRQQYSRDAHDSEFNRIPSPEPRRKSACSVPHSDKSNDSSDVDSVHSLPIDHAERLNASMPISYADIAKNSSLERPKWNRPPSERKTLENPEPEVEAQNWPAIQINNNINNKPEVTKTNKIIKATSIKTSPPIQLKNNLKNVQKIPQQSVNNIHVEAAVQILQNSGNVQVLPHNIPDVQTIEKMHLKQLMQQQGYVQDIMNNHGYVLPYEAHRPVTDCDERTSSSRPAVVILSGDNREVSGITFGFDINEQLLSDDVCDNFTARFYVPDVFQSHNHDKIVNFIGLAWEDTINQANGKVKYFSEQL